MAQIVKTVCAATYTPAQEQQFPPRNVVTVTITNGAAWARLASTTAVNTWQGAPFEAQERYLLPGVWVFTSGEDTPAGSQVCGVQVRSDSAVQQATATVSA